MNSRGFKVFKIKLRIYKYKTIRTFSKPKSKIKHNSEILIDVTT